MFITQIQLGAKFNDALATGGKERTTRALAMLPLPIGDDFGHRPFQQDQDGVLHD